jgi:DNA-binding CsgD family transcriptional regulator
MRHLNSDEQAVLDVVQKETNAFWTRDEATFQNCHANLTEALRWGYWQGGGMFIQQGFDNIVPRSIEHMRSLDRSLPEIANAPISNLVVRVSGDMAWVRFDRMVPYVPDLPFGQGPNGTMHLLFILERLAGQWQIVVTTMLDAHLGDETAVKVVGDGTVLWVSHMASMRLSDDPSFLIRNGKLRLRPGRLDGRLRSAILWATGIGGPLMPRRGAVPLVVETAPGATRVAWVIADDIGSAIVFLDDRRPVADRIAGAAAVFGLAPAQYRVALAVSEGRSLADFAAAEGVSLNTAKTHMRRVFEKVGVSSQSALVAVLLSLTPPR